MFNWDNTRSAVRELKEVLKCKLCHKIPADPVNYSMCGHFCCKTCVKGKRNSCPLCGMTCLSSEITSEHLINNLITGMKIISETIGVKSSVEDSSGESCTAVDGDNSSKPSSKRSSTNSPSTERKGKKPRNSRSKNSNQPARTEAKKSISRKSDVKNINKRNAKGETDLQVACIKGKTELVKEYLEAGANPNTKDHAGWTPLLEAVNHGFIDIVELLLQYGAMVSVPGYENITPLHEAVSNGRVEIVKLLLRYGADLEARNIIGVTPRDLALTDEMKEVLNSAPGIAVMKPLIEIKEKNMDPAEMVVFGCNLEKEQHKQLVSLSQRFKFRLLQTYVPELTHIIVQTDQNSVCSSSRDVIQAILQGKWILSYEWIRLSLKMEALVDPHEFEVKGTTHFPKSEAPRRARLNAEKQFPGIFNGCHIYLSGFSTNFTVDNYKLTKADVTALVRIGDGVILSREPDPEGIPQRECTVPYHAPSGGTLTRCSHYIIYRQGKDQPQLKYNMSHIKSLPLQWLLDCMENFTLNEPF